MIDKVILSRTTLRQQPMLRKLQVNVNTKNKKKKLATSLRNYNLHVADVI